MTIKRKANEEKKDKRLNPLVNINDLISPEWHVSPSNNPLHALCPQVVVFRAMKPYPAKVVFVCGQETASLGRVIGYIVFTFWASICLAVCSFGICGFMFTYSGFCFT
jgi:hypothetical protein